MKRKHQLPTISELPINIDLEKLQQECLKFSSKFVDVKTANPALCMNHEELVKSVYDNFEQINLTEASEILPHTANVKERLRRREEHLYNVPTKEYIGSYFKEIVDQCIAPASRVRITKLAAGKEIPFHVDYDTTYAVRCICPIFTDSLVVNQWKRNDVIEEYVLEEGKAYFLNIGYPHSVINKSNNPRIALMFSLDGQADIANL